MFAGIKKGLRFFPLLILLFALSFLFAKNASTTHPSPAPSLTPPATPLPTQTTTPARTPDPLPVADDPFKKSIIAAGEYLVRQQLANGELSYQVDFLSGKRAYAPSNIRLVEGTGSLYTVCRVAADIEFCEAGDLALAHYLELLVRDPKTFKGACLYADGACQLSGSALTVDVIYKRWQAAGDFSLKDQNLLDTAMELGYFLVSLKKPEGGLYHSFDPHFSGMVDPSYFLSFSDSQALVALLELYEMTGNAFWLDQAVDLNHFLLSQPYTEDLWHTHALRMFARLGLLDRAGAVYAAGLAETVIKGEVRSLDPKNSSASSSAKIEALASAAQALKMSGAEHEWLYPDIRAFIEFVQARQLPENPCSWSVDREKNIKFSGGIFNSCEDASIRIDSLQHWIDGGTAYLEYLAMLN